MAQHYSPRIVTDNLVMCLDPSQNKSYPTTDLPIKDRLALWLDAADDSTFSYSSGTSVSQWRDKSGNNRHFFQSTAGNQPSRSSVINSRKTVQFTAASSQYLRYNSTIINNTTAGSVFFVWRTAGETQAYANLLDNYHGGSNALYAGFSIERNNVSDQLYWGFYSSGFTQAGATGPVSYSNNTSYLYYITKDSTNITAKANGYIASTYASPSATWVEDTKGWLIGCWGSNTETFSRFYNGQIAEIIIFSKGLSDIEAKQVTNYLSLKWNTENINRSIFDLSGLDDHGLLGNGTTAYMPAFDYYNNGSLKFDGSDDYVDLGTSSNLVNLTNNITVEAWIKIPVPTNRYTIYGNGYTGTGMMFGTSANTPGGLEVYYPGIYVAYSTAGVLQPNVWQHVAYTRNGSGLNTHAFYINGVSQTVTQTANGGDSWGTSGTNRYLGLRSGVMFNGQMSSVKVYSRGLSAAEILQNYQAQKSKFDNTIVQQGLVLNLDAGNPYSYAGAGTTWYDVSGNAINASASGTSSYINLNGGLLSFPNNNSYYNTSAVSTFNLGASSFSMESWVYLDAATASDNTYRGIISLGLDASNYVYIAKWRSGLYSGLYVQYNVAAATVTGVYQANDYNPSSRWTHVVATKSGSTLSLYVNGVFYGSAANLTTTFTGNSSVYISQAHGGVSSLYGYIGESRVYNIALSAAQVLQNYNATKGRFGL